MIIVQQIKESWSEIWDQLEENGFVHHEPGVISSYGFIDDEDFPQAFAEFRLTGRPYEGATRTLILTTCWSSFIYQFFTRKGENFVLYNGGRNGFLQQNLFPIITLIDGTRKDLDLD